MVRIRLTEMVTFEIRPGHEKGSMMGTESISCSGNNENKVPEVGTCLDCLWRIG